jgi:DNA-binding SARP family transcriptional activator
MSSVDVHLLGTPAVLLDGRHRAPPRGRKAWALLAYLLVSRGPHTRQHLASLLFSEAEDPLGALRWNLSELRRLLAVPPDAASGVSLKLPSGSLLDVELVGSGEWSQALRLPGLGKELLEGMSFPTSPAFEAWLAAQRSRLAAACEAVLGEAVLDRLGAGEFEAAAELAGRLVQMNPLDENHHALLVRSLAAGGRPEAARRQLEACEELFRRELGTPPTLILREALRPRSSRSGSSPVSGSAAAMVQLEAGEAAIRAGAVDAGLECLRRAGSEAADCANTPLLAEALVALGAALIHAAQGRDQEGAVILHEALSHARSADAPLLLAQACRELAHVDINGGRHDRAEVWLMRAEEWAGDDRSELASVYGNRGKSLADRGRHDEALGWLERSLDLADAVRDRRQTAWSLSIIGRTLLLRRELAPAQEALTRSLELARVEAWNAFLPWPELMLAELHLLQGHSGVALQGFEHALALARQLDDACWETAALRGLALTAAASERVEAALALFDEARARWARFPDTYVWMAGYALDAQAGVLTAAGRPGAAAVIDRLEQLSARTGMQEFLVRAHLHRSRGGDQSALATAQLLARSVDNSFLFEPTAHH